MSELDLDLIDEFRMVPAFYDKNCEEFKDKAFVESAWHNIGRKLCYNVNLLKDRMFKLRNRYNMENRRLQAMREEGIIDPKPKWPMFDNLNFLSGHIKQRRTFKMMRTLKWSPRFRGFTKKDCSSSISHPYMINREHRRERKINNEIDAYNHEMEEDPLSLATCSENPMSVPEHSVSKLSQTLNNINLLKQSLLDGTDARRKATRKHCPSAMYQAFGSFVNNSLQLLPEEKAMLIIDSFTSEIVRSLIAYRAETFSG